MMLWVSTHSSSRLIYSLKSLKWFRAGIADCCLSLSHTHSKPLVFANSALANSPIRYKILVTIYSISNYLFSIRVSLNALIHGNDRGSLAKLYDPAFNALGKLVVKDVMI
jgi:hypothetical protein